MKNKWSNDQQENANKEQNDDQEHDQREKLSKVRVTINWKPKKVKVKVKTWEDLWKSKPAEGNVTIDQNQNRKWEWQKNFKSKNLKKVKWEEWPKRKPEGNEERDELCRTGLSTFSAEATRKSYWYKYK